MQGRVPRFWIAALMAAAILAPTLQAQSISGALTGTVYDPTGAVVPGAAIVLRNAASGDTRKAESNEAGYFTIAGVLPGTYSVLVDAPGFKKWERSGIVFNPGDKRNISDINLQVADSGQQVVVTAEAPSITPVDSGERSAVITSKQLDNISIVGRSATEFIKMLPGMSITSGHMLRNEAGYSGESVGINAQGTSGQKTSAVGSYAANGNDSGSIAIVSDGAHVSDPAVNDGTPVNPNADMVQEIKVFTSSYGADNPKGPVVVQTVSKSGGQAFHGQSYMYARHWAMNANTWEGNRAAGYKDGKPVDNRPRSKYFFPGGSLSGPVLIPGTNFNKGRDKMFFFTGFEYYRQAVDVGMRRAVVPTPEWLAGDFSPAANAKGGYADTWGWSTPADPRFVNGVLPERLMDPGGKALIKLYPKPNADPALTGGFNWISPMVIDQNSWQSLTRLDYGFSDNVKLFVRYNLQKELQQFPLGVPWQAQTNSVPYPSPVEGRNQSQSLAANLTQVLGPTLTNEIVAARTYINFPNEIADREKVSREALGYPYKGIFKKSDIIPNLQSWNSGIATIYNPGGFNPSLFYTKNLTTLSDNLVKVAGTHTLKLGGYFEYTNNKQMGGAHDQGMFVFPNWSQYNIGNVYAGLLLGEGWHQYEESAGNRVSKIGMRPLEFYVQDSWKVSRRLTLEGGVRFQHMPRHYDMDGQGFAIFDPARYSANPADVNSRPGIVWHGMDSSVPNGGANTPFVYFAPRAGFAYDAFGNGRTVLRGGFGVFRYNDILKRNMDALDTSYNMVNYGGDAAHFHSLGVYSFKDLETFTPGASGKQSWTVLDTKDIDHPVTYSYNLTVTHNLPGKVVWESAYVGSQSANLSGRKRLNAVPWGAMLANPNGNADDYRPLQNFRDLQAFSNYLKSNYNALQTSATKQSGRLNIMANYTFSKALGNRGGEEGYFGLGEAYAKQVTYGVLSFDRTHIFNVAYTADIPGPRSGGVAKHALGGWQVSGVSQWQSGVNLASAGNTSFFVQEGIPGANKKTISGSEDVGIFPFVICDPRKGLARGQYANGSCFAAPGPGQTGDSTFPYLRGPSFMNHDLSVFKNFVLAERQKIQFRFSAFNFLNHPLPSFIEDDANLKLRFNSEGRMINDRFGYADNKYGHRIIQLAVKYSF